MRFYYRTSRHSAVSMPLWLAAIVYLIGAVIVAAVVLLALAAALLYLLVLAAVRAVGWHRR